MPEVAPMSPVLLLQPNSAAVECNGSIQFSCSALPPADFSWSDNCPNGLYSAPAHMVGDMDLISVSVGGPIVPGVPLAPGQAGARAFIYLRATFVALMPRYTKAFQKGVVQFSTNIPCTWSVPFGGGWITEDGLFTASDVGSCVVVATSVYDPTKWAEAVVEICPHFPAGVWECSDGKTYRVAEDGFCYDVADEASVGMSSSVRWGRPIL